MHKRYFEKLLISDSLQLKEMFEILKQNTIFNEVIKNVKKQYFIKDKIHGISHNERVYMLACYIATKEGLSEEETKLVLEAALYHDIGRGYEGNHGAKSAEIIEKNKEYIFPDLNDDEINVIKALCNCHSVNDERYEEIAEVYGVKDLARLKKLLDVLKDADALDRVRLQRFGKLDEKYLRTNTAKGMVEIAENLYSEYTRIQKDDVTRIEEDEKSKIKDNTENRTLDKTRKKPILSDGENYYLIRSLNKNDIQNLDNGNDISPKIDTQSDSDTYTTEDILSQVKMQHKKTSLISITEAPNVVLTFDRNNLHRFVLIKIPKEEVEQNDVLFSVGDYLLDVMKARVEEIYQESPDNVKQILDRVEQVTTKQEIIEIINGADRTVSVSLIETNQQYLTQEEQIEQSKVIAKCKVLYYYGLMREVDSGKDIKDYCATMRLAYSSSEWLHYGKIKYENMISIPLILVEALALLEQAKFQGKDTKEIEKIEQQIFDLVKSRYELKENGDVFEFSNGEKSIGLDSISKILKEEYSSHSEMQAELTIDRAFEITNGGEVNYRDANMQAVAIRSLAEMTLKKRAIIELLSKITSNQNIMKMLKDTYCINREMMTKVNNRGRQISRNVNLVITNYGYDLEDEVSINLIQCIDSLSTEQLIDININGVNSSILKGLILRVKEDNERIESYKSKTPASRYIAEAIVEGYNWRKDGNSLTKKEKELLAKKLLMNNSSNNELYKLYEAINKTQIGNNKFSQNEIFAIIINIAIDGKLGETTYKELLEMSMHEIQMTLLDNSESLQTSVLPISIDLLAGRGRDLNKLKKELIDIGVSKEIIETRDIRNVYVAKQIVDGYEFGEEINSEERKAIIESILSNYGLKRGLLTGLIKNMERIGLSQQEIYGMIINLGINSSVIQEPGYDYTCMIANQNNVCQTISKYRDQIQTEVTSGTILTAKSTKLNERDIQALKSELVNLGVSKEIIETRDIENVYVAKQIVDDYEFGEEINSEERIAMIELILSNITLKTEHTSYLTTLIKNMEKIGFSQQEIYGMIINLGIYGSVLEDSECNYTTMLMNKKNVCQTISKYKAQVQTEVTEGTILTAKSMKLNEREVQDIEDELINLGISKEIIETKGIRNVYVAKHIVDGYKFEKEINANERRAIIESILSNNVLKRCFLTRLIKEMEKIGLNQQEIYGMIINLSINGRVLEEAGYDYTAMLMNKKNACQTISKYKDRIQTEVTEGTILTAKSIQLNESQIKDLEEELTNLGVSKEIIETRDIRNVYVAKQIVDGYEFGEEINSDEKRAMIESILSNSRLTNGSSSYLTTLIKKMEQIGLKQNEIYGMIINLGINGVVLPEAGYDYSALLYNQNNACQTISKHKDKIQTKVTKGTILTDKSMMVNERDVKDIENELVNLGVSKEIIETIDIRNLYVAKQIVDGYEFGKK